jgi:hypothetical protein
MSDCIALDLDTLVHDKARFSKGKYSFIAKHLIESEIHYENQFPYSRLILEGTMMYTIILSKLTIGKIFMSTMKKPNLAFGVYSL